MRNRKLDLVPPSFTLESRFSADADKLKGQVIQSAHQVVDSVASYSGNIGTVDEERIELKSWLSGIRVRIKPDSLEYWADKSASSIFQVVDVLIGPFNFYADQSQSVVGGHGLLP